MAKYEHDMKSLSYKGILAYSARKCFWTILWGLGFYWTFHAAYKARVK